MRNLLAVPRKWEASSIGFYDLDRAYEFYLRLDNIRLSVLRFLPDIRFRRACFIMTCLLITEERNWHKCRLLMRPCSMPGGLWNPCGAQTLVIHMIRTPKLPFIQSRASAPVTLLTFTGIAVLTVIPFTALGKMLGFVALPAAYFCLPDPLHFVVYVLATSIKKAYVRHFGELL